MSNMFAFVLIIGIAMFAKGMGGPLTIPLMAIGAVGMVVSAFMPTRKRKKPNFTAKDWD